MMQNDRWLIKYNGVKDFMARDNRKPSKYYPEEKLKFHIILHYKKLYYNGTLKTEGLEMFKQLLEMCEMYRRKKQYE